MFEPLSEVWPWFNWEFAGALLSFLLLVAACSAFGVYLFRVWRDYRDDKKSALDTQ